MAAADKVSVSGVTYSQAEAGYFEKRSLKRTAGFWGIWGIGIAAVISGDFSGWNGGLAVAGWGGLVIAFGLVIVMFLLMINSIAEMAAAMPHTGGAYSFARAAMGPWGGFVTGFAETIEYVMTTAVVTYFSAQYADQILDTLVGVSLQEQSMMWIWWLVLYAVFVGLNSIGANTSFRFAIIVAIISLGILLVFAVLSLTSGAFDVAKLFDQPVQEGGSAFLPFGFWAVIAAMPFAMWFFLGIEELPLVAEEAHDPEKDIPRASIWGFVTLIVTGGTVLLLNPGVLGAEATAGSLEPLLEGFRSVIPAELAAVLSAFALIGLLASLQGIMFAYGRNVYSLSRAGYYPKFLSLTGARQTPYVALIAGAVVGFLSLFLAEYGGATAGGIVLNIAVWGAVIAYMLQMVSYVILRRKFPNARRPFRSVFGVPGAIIAGVLAFVIWMGENLNPAYTPAIVAAIVVYVIALVLFALFGRRNLVLSPEEEYAMSGGLHGDPAAEGYGGAVEDEILDRR
jgi:ethanolamine permease